MFICKFCGRSLKTKSACTQHEKYYCALNSNKQKKHQTRFYTEHKKVPCTKCGKFFDVANIKRHENSCGKSSNSVYHVTHEGLQCIFCGKLCKNKNSLAQHEVRCSKNPERKNFDSLITYIAKESAEERNFRCQKSLNTLRSKIASGEVRYDNSIRSKYKFGTYRGYHCDSSWELAFVIFNLDHNIVFYRNTESFPYEYNGTLHHYYPDFIVDNVYYEIKSFKNDKVYNKCRDFPKEKQLVIIDQEKIQPYLDYCESTYGKDFFTLYDRTSPSWMDLSI